MEAFRFNERKHKGKDRGRFRRILRGACGKRLTYREVAGKALSKWIELDYDVILKYWDGEIAYTEDAIAALKPIH